MQAQDTAGNIGDSPAVTARIDNTPPGRVDVSVEGGDGVAQPQRLRGGVDQPARGRPRADRGRRATSSARSSAGAAAAGEQAGADLSRFGVAVPAPGEWTVSLWRRDAAGNESEDAASVPVTLRYDPEPPQLGFEPPSAADPTLVAVAGDRQGLRAGGRRRSRSARAGSGIWQALPTQKDGSRLLARIDDAALPAGGYLLRARAADQAHNEASTDRRLDGQPMALTLPVRIVSTMQAGFERVRIGPADDPPARQAPCGSAAG